MSENDSWKDVEAELLKAIGHPHVAVTDLPPDTFVARFFAARAAEATQHRQKIVAKDETIRQLEMEVGLWNQWGQQNPQTLQASKLTAEITTLRAERDRLKAALSASEARIYPDVNFERYLDDTSSTLVELVNDLSDGGDEHAAAAIQQATEAIGHLRRTRDELRRDLERVSRAALSGEGTAKP